MTISSLPTSPNMGIIALVDYISSPSSTNSWDAFMYADLPQLMISTGGRTQSQTQSTEQKALTNSRMIWIKKPY